MGTESNYMKNDGCNLATMFLGKQSHCFECPFPDCLLGTNAGKLLAQQLYRNEEIRKLREQEGMTIPALCKKYRLSQTHIYRILAGGKQE
jgi:hypothetical protein